MKQTLPRMPAKGQRRNLEAQWLDVLEAGEMPGEAIHPQGSAPAQLDDAIRLFNNGLYWECHEVLEEVWLETPYPQRFFWSALIKLAVGFHHVGRHNLHGARVKLGTPCACCRCFSRNSSASIRQPPLRTPYVGSKT